MKTKIIIGGLLLMFTANNSFSQAANSKGTNDDYAIALVRDVKGSLSSLTNNTSTDASDLVNTKVKKIFDKYFLGATGQKWEINGKNFQTTFWKDEMLTYALFGKNGYLFYSVTFVPEQKLPGDLMKMIKNKYLNYTIPFAAEVKYHDRNIWILNLENEKQILTLRVEDDNIELVETAEK